MAAEDFDDDFDADGDADDAEELPIDELDDDIAAPEVGDDLAVAEDDDEAVADADDDEDDDEEEEASPVDEDDDVVDLDEDDDEEAEETLEVLLDPEEAGPSKKRSRKRATADPLSETTNPAGEGEFTCRSCFLVKRRAQLADTEQLICVDCA